MQKELLEECLAEGLSLEAIGKRFGRHEATVSYWLKKHGPVAARAEKHGAKGAPSKEEMERLLVAGLSLRELAHQLGRSLGTVRHWMERYDLKPNRAASVDPRTDPVKWPLSADGTAIRPSCARAGVTTAADGAGTRECRSNGGSSSAS